LTGALLEALPRAGPPFEAAQVGSHDGHLLGMGVAVAVLLVIVFMATTGGVRALGALVRTGRTAYRTRTLTPQKIVDYQGPAPVEETPALISRRIVERSEQIRKALAAEPSETEVAMYAMGYCACADDLLVLSQVVDRRTATSGPIRRFTMLRAVRCARASLACTHPQGASGARTRQAVGRRSAGGRIVIVVDERHSVCLRHRYNSGRDRGVVRATNAPHAPFRRACAGGPPIV